jgi:hypothetical protein
MTVIGNKICSFPKCGRPAIAHILKMHYYQTGNLMSKEAVCEPHEACVMEPDDKTAMAMLTAISNGEDWKALATFRDFEPGRHA